jgi:hypothetical protein
MDDADLTARGDRLFHALVKDAAAAGYGEYRTHLSYMDEVADTFSYNDHALRRFNERVKDAIDPNGILAPGRNGIWPLWRNGEPCALETGAAAASAKWHCRRCAVMAQPARTQGAVRAPLRHLSFRGWWRHVDA